MECFLDSGTMLFIAILSAVHAITGNAPTQLLLEYLASPVVGIDVVNPRFRWVADYSTDLTETERVLFHNINLRA